MWNSSFIAIISFQNIPKYFCVKYMIYYILLHVMYRACSKKNILNSWTDFQESWALFLCKCNPIPISFVSRQTPKSHVRCFCDCRWSYRTAAATSQRRKERHRQQTEHLGLDNNDLKEVRQNSPSSPVSDLLLLLLHLLLPLLVSNAASRPSVFQCAKYPSIFLLIVTQHQSKFSEYAGSL